jgi:hypothetical protein
LDQFDWDGQAKATQNILKLLKPHPQSLVIGQLIGNTEPGEYTDDSNLPKKVYRHDIQSFKKMFHSAGDVLGEKWETEVESKPWESPFKRTTQPGLLTINFVARRLERLDAATSHYFVF